MMAPVYKLYYFNIRGRAEVSRLLFALAGQEYEDIRVEFQQWPAMKPNTPFGKLPYLEVVDGNDRKTLAQGVTIARYLARNFGLAGQNDWEAAKIDELTDYLQETAKTIPEWSGAMRAGDNAKADAIAHQWTTVDILPYLQGLERLLQSNNGGQGWFVGEKPSWGDVAVASFLFQMLRLCGTLLDKYPLLKGHYNRVHDLKGIKEWVDKRPDSYV